MLNFSAGMIMSIFIVHDRFKSVGEGGDEFECAADVGCIRECELIFESTDVADTDVISDCKIIVFPYSC